MLRDSRYCLLESLAHANIATIADGEMTVMERRQWNSGFCQNFLHGKAWEDIASVIFGLGTTIGTSLRKQHSHVRVHMHFFVEIGLAR